MKISFQADADLKSPIIRAVRRREPAVDFRTAVEVNLTGLADEEVLALAAEAGRVLVTHDGKTMPGHFGDFISERESPGVLILPQDLPIGIATEQLLLIWAASEAAEWVNRICRLPL